MLPSTMNRFFTSWQRPHSLTTERSGSVPMRAVPSRCQPPFRIGLSTADIAGAGGRQDLLRPRDAVVHHRRRVLAHACSRSSAPGCRCVLQHRIERDAVVLLRQVLADRRQPDAAVEQLRGRRGGGPRPRAAGRPPSLTSASMTGADAAAELEGVAAHEAARSGRSRRTPGSRGTAAGRVAVERLVDIAVDQRIGVEHQVLADQPAGIGQAVGESLDAELSSRRGVPMPLQATTTTSAGWNCSTPSAS